MKITTVLVALSLLTSVSAFAEEQKDEKQQLVEAQFTLAALQKNIGPATSDCKGCQIGDTEACDRFKATGASAADQASAVAANYVAAAGNAERRADADWAKVIEGTEALEPKIKALAACSTSLEAK